MVVPPYPYSIEEDRHDVPLEDCWTARPQLFFSCFRRPKGGRMPKTCRFKTGPDMVGRIPLMARLMPCFLDGNVTQTITQKYSKNKNSCFPAGCAEAAAEDGRRGSKIYEVNRWLWQFGRCKPRLGGDNRGDWRGTGCCLQSIGQASEGGSWRSQ